MMVLEKKIKLGKAGEHRVEREVTFGLATIVWWSGSRSLTNQILSVAITFETTPKTTQSDYIPVVCPSELLSTHS